MPETDPETKVLIKRVVRMLFWCTIEGIVMGTVAACVLWALDWIMETMH